jgi:predicted alpha/beta-hydrolase family hydrolase
MTDENVTINQLKISTSTGEPLANRFLRKSRPADSLAVVYPGLRYNCDKPLLYYTSQALSMRGVDVLQSWSDYNQAEIESLSQTDLTLRMVSDAQAMLATGLQARPYKKLILVGKSIGSLVMAFILSQEPPLKIAYTIWLTPLLQIPFVTATIQNLTTPVIVAGGTADTTFDPASVALLDRQPNLSLLRVEGANHNLEIPGDLRQSLTAISDLVDRILNLSM